MLTLDKTEATLWDGLRLSLPLSPTKKNMKYRFIIGLIFSLSLSCSATPQLLDMLIMNKDTFFLYNSPLSKKSNLIERDSNFTKNRILTTANRRGYVASWELIGDEIFLTKINDITNGTLEANLQTIFRTKENKRKIKATWLNEEIVAHSKYSLQGYRIGLSDVYEEEYILKFNNGILIETKHLSNNWAKYPKDNTTLLNKYIIKKLSRKLRRQILKDRLEYDFYTYVTFNANRKIKSVEFTETEFDTSELQKDIEKFEDWNFVYKKGKLMNEYAVRIHINEIEIKRNKKCW